MDTDDLESVKKPKTIDFDTLSVEELTEYIEELVWNQKSSWFYRKQRKR